MKIELMNAINSRVTDDLPSDAVYVASSNEEVRQINTQKLSELQGDIKTIDAEYTIQKKDGSGNIILMHSDLPTEEDICEIVVPSAYDSQLSFKKGARVVLCKSSKRWGYVNGDFGVIKDFNGDFFTILLDGGTTIKCPNPNDRYKYQQMNEYRYEMKYDQTTHSLIRKTPYVQKTKQFPIKLAYAFTIHKAQGQTFEKVIIDLNSHIFATGQLYVALSRAKSLQSLYLTKPIVYSDIISDDSIFIFLDRIRSFNHVGQCKIPSCPKVKNTAHSLCNDFSFIVDNNEQNTSSKVFILHSLKSFVALMELNEFEKAYWELQKVVDLIISTYQANDYTAIFNTIRQPVFTYEGCKLALTAVSEMYIEVVGQPQKQYQTENRTITVKLSD